MIHHGKALPADTTMLYMVLVLSLPVKYSKMNLEAANSSSVLDSLRRVWVVVVAGSAVAVLAALAVWRAEWERDRALFRNRASIFAGAIQQHRDGVEDLRERHAVLPHP